MLFRSKNGSTTISRQSSRGAAARRLPKRSRSKRNRSRSRRLSRPSTSSAEAVADNRSPCLTPGAYSLCESDALRHRTGALRKSAPVTGPAASRPNASSLGAGDGKPSFCQHVSRSGINGYGPCKNTSLTSWLFDVAKARGGRETCSAGLYTH